MVDEPRAHSFASLTSLPHSLERNKLLIEWLELDLYLRRKDGSKLMYSLRVIILLRFEYSTLILSSFDAPESFPIVLDNAVECYGASPRLLWRQYFQLRRHCDSLGWNKIYLENHIRLNSRLLPNLNGR